MSNQFNKRITKHPKHLVKITSGPRKGTYFAFFGPYEEDIKASVAMSCIDTKDAYKFVFHEHALQLQGMLGILFGLSSEIVTFHFPGKGRTKMPDYPGKGIFHPSR